MDVRNYLNRKFPNKWIGRGGPHDFPARTSDLTPMVYFLWCYVKNIVYSTSSTKLKNMQHRDRSQTVQSRKPTSFQGIIFNVNLQVVPIEALKN